jgi:hypothetical protein
MSLFATRRMPILVGLLAALAACSTGQTINDRDLSQLKVAGSPIHTVLFTDDGSNGLAVITPQASGLTGTKENVVMAAGKAWTNEFDLPHPLGLTRDRFVTRLKSQAGIYQFRESPRALDVSHERPDRLREEFGDRGAVLDFRGTYEVVFYAKDPSRYHLVYEARVRLLRLDDWKPHRHSGHQDCTDACRFARPRRGATQDLAGARRQRMQQPADPQFPERQRLRLKHCAGRATAQI